MVTTVELSLNYSWKKTRSDIPSQQIFLMIYIYDKDILEIDHFFLLYSKSNVWLFKVEKRVFFYMNFKNISHMYLDI